MKLQNIIFPERVIKQEDLAMYYRASEKFYYSDDNKCYILSKKENVWFDTYFNAFSLAKWKKYTHLGELKLSLTLQGKFDIELRGFSLSKDGVHHSQPFVRKRFAFAEPQNFMLEFLPNDFEIVFFRVTAITDVKFFSGAFYSDISDISEEKEEKSEKENEKSKKEEKINDVNISLVICTFKREKYLKENLQILNNEIFESDDEVAKHLSVKVIDNGKTLTKQDVELNDKIRLYPNKNCGGAGGFTRGMIETLRDSQNFSHILLMDDDVIVNTESIVRTYNLLRILKEEFKDAFICGAMMRLDKKYLIHENLAVFSDAPFIQNGSHPIFPIKSTLDVRDIWSILFNEKEEKFSNRYQGWWYCCIPTTSISLDDLPLPIFIRGDDIEFSLRKQPEMITLNAICVWHESFDNKLSNLMENYFASRTMLLMKLLYLNQNKYVILQSFQKRFRTLIYAYNYLGAESLLDAFEDYMKGYNFYLESDGQNILQKQQVKNETWSKLDNFQNIVTFFTNPMYNCEALFSEKPATFIERLMMRITMGGLLFPSIFFKKSIGFLRSGFAYNPSQSFRREKILAINTIANTGVLRVFSRIKTARLYWRCFILSRKYLKYHDKLKKEWQENMHKMINVDSWSKILEIKE